jgi:REP element-mobilizing transposase RayT
MPREPRVLIDDGLYHVYSRTAPGKPVFEDTDEVREFISLLRELGDRDGWTVYAWSVMTTHYHLALRTSSILLSRTMHALHGRLAQGYNRRHETYGPVWQGRYKTRLVVSHDDIERLLVYIHLEPVRAGAVEDAADYPFSGHRELVGDEPSPVADVDAALLCFGDTTTEGRRQYVERIHSAHQEEWIDEIGTPSWWRAGGDRELGLAGAEEQVDILGRSIAAGRPLVSEEQYIEAASEALGADLEELVSRRRRAEVARWRLIIATVGLERFFLRAKHIGRLLRKNPDWISALATRGARLRSEDAEFRDACLLVEAAVVDAIAGGETELDEEPEPGWAVWD